MGKICILLQVQTAKNVQKNASPLRTRDSVEKEEHITDMFSRTCHTHVGKSNHIITFTSDKYSVLEIQTRRGQRGIAQQAETVSLECCQTHSQKTSLNGLHTEKSTVKNATLH